MGTTDPFGVAFEFHCPFPRSSSIVFSTGTPLSAPETMMSLEWPRRRSCDLCLMASWTPNSDSNNRSWVLPFLLLTAEKGLHPAGNVLQATQMQNGVLTEAAHKQVHRKKWPNTCTGQVAMQDPHQQVRRILAPHGRFFRVFKHNTMWSSSTCISA